MNFFEIWSWIHYYHLFKCHSWSLQEQRVTIHFKKMNKTFLKHWFKIIILFFKKHVFAHLRKILTSFSDWICLLSRFTDYFWTITVCWVVRMILWASYWIYIWNNIRWVRAVGVFTEGRISQNTMWWTLRKRWEVIPGQIFSIYLLPRQMYHSLAEEFV